MYDKSKRILRSKMLLRTVFLLVCIGYGYCGGVAAAKGLDSIGLIGAFIGPFWSSLLVLPVLLVDEQWQAGLAYKVCTVLFTLLAAPAGYTRFASSPQFDYLGSVEVELIFNLIPIILFERSTHFVFKNSRERKMPRWKIASQWLGITITVYLGGFIAVLVIMTAIHAFVHHWFGHR